MANHGGQRAAFKARIVEYLGGSCVVCGYNKCPSALHAHHKDPKVKKFTVSAYRCCRWVRVQKELDKCELLCANCHAEKHHQNYPEYPRPRKQESQIEWPAKKDLSRLVWALPLTKIAQRLGVSDVAVRKRCKKLSISTPSRGHWLKKEQTCTAERYARPEAAIVLAPVAVYSSQEEGKS